MALSRFLDPKNDVAFKKIFGSEKNKDILIHFLNDMLLFKGNNQITEIEFLNTIQDPDIASKKQSIVDVLCKSGVQYIIEMQVDPSIGFEKRAQYYAAKAYCRQTNRGREEDGKYSNLKEIIFIAIAGCILFPQKREYISRHVILDKNSYEHDLKDFSFTFIELPKFKKDKVEELNNITEKWCYFFKHAKETTEEELQKIIGTDLVIRRAYEALDQFNWSEEELISYEQELKRIWDNRAVEEYKLQHAKEEGIQIGKAEGKAEGEYSKTVEIAKKMLSEDCNISLIAAITGLDEPFILSLKK
ncbi:MAG: Rpn family recombination-promoting nuclease/putative transposase [Rickettsia endosymbiont of Oxypoda opaca]|nr:Rpn family recombination-promoting nuclease/putative transposase [Rickettsia endosymbiont of Oxypoda opaca]